MGTFLGLPLYFPLSLHGHTISSSAELAEESSGKPAGIRIHFLVAKHMLLPSGLEWQHPSSILASHNGAGRETKAICPPTNTWESAVTSQRPTTMILPRGRFRGPAWQSFSPLPTSPLRGYTSNRLRHIVQ